MATSEFFAHSSRDERRPQTYYDHLLGETGVVKLAEVFASSAVRSHPKLSKFFPEVVALAAELHDLGKLNSENQSVLRGDKKAKRLPRDHVDAGTATLLEKHMLAAAVCVFSHHRGLPNIQAEQVRKSGAFRARQNGDPDSDPDYEWSDRERGELLKLHKHMVGNSRLDAAVASQQLTKLELRIALSCLVDADHTDTAKYYQPETLFKWPTLQAKCRIERLNQYLKSLDNPNASVATRQRNSLRSEFYRTARDTTPSMVGVISCEAPVGSGKTTAVIAHLLSVAAQKGLERIIVVLPYTTIIDQTVDVLRKALVLDGEDPELVVTAHHHRADFPDPHLRGSAITWNGPIVVTTAVQFFETISAAGTATLRKLHRIAHAGVMIDEAHACIPIHLWPRHFSWLWELCKNWGTYAVLASGSLCKFWKIKELAEDTNGSQDIPIPSLISDALISQMSALEAVRYSFFSYPTPLSVDGLIELIRSKRGPRIVVLNTVEGAARVASRLANMEGRDKVLHLSTALTPRDRIPIIQRIKERLSNPTDEDWTLVATSCVEAGMDFSFQTGFRERASLLSFIQLGGRVNRSLSKEGAEMFDFVVDDALWPQHPAFKDSRIVFKEMIDEGKVTAESSTEAISRTLHNTNAARLVKDLQKAEVNGNFPYVEKLCRLIAEGSITVLVDQEIAKRISIIGHIPARELQLASVQIFPSNAKIRDWAIEELSKESRLFRWTLDYDPEFLGYMSGVLSMDPIRKGDCVVI